MLCVTHFRSSFPVNFRSEILTGCIFLDTIHRNISNRKLIVPIKRLIHFAGVAETTSPPEKFGEKIIQLLEEDNFLSDDRY